MKCFCMIEIAFDKIDEVNKVIEVLLAKKLAASCQVINCDSTWIWREKIEASKEYLLLVKTRVNLSKEVYDEVRKIHSYETFEFAQFDLSSYSNEYMNWLNSAIRK